MYIKKKDRELFEEIDRNLSLPKQWNKFIHSIKLEHNLIIKNSNNCYCTCCKSLFNLKKVKINDYIKCPKCHKEFLVKSSKLKYYEFNDWIGVVDKYKDYYIIRHFEVRTYFSSGKLDTDICEYARKIYDNSFNKKYEIINHHLLNYLGGSSIVHNGTLFDSNWHYIDSCYCYIGDDLIYYYENLKNLFKSTKWQYSQIWKLAQKEKYFDISYLLNHYVDSIELLIKLGFYRLALCPNAFNKKGNFEERFGINKEYQSFIKKHNLNINELEILKLIKSKDIKLIKKLSFINSDYAFFRDNNIDLKILIQKTDFCANNLHEYKDYIIFCKQLHYNLKDKKNLYPTKILESHNKLLNQIETVKNKKINAKIMKRHRSLTKNTFQDKKYIIFPAASMTDLVNESSQQNNCVRTYAEKYAEGICDIYFMRLINDQDNSLVTVEVRDSKIYQQRTKNNEITTASQRKFLKKWEMCILRKEKEI